MEISNASKVLKPEESKSSAELKAPPKAPDSAEVSRFKAINIGGCS